MPLTSATRLGAYEITHVLGAGGMGEGVSDDTQISVVMNWFEELKARMSARR